MKFQLTDTYLYWWPVTIECPDPKRPGKAIKQSFEMQFEAIGQEEADAITERVAALSPEEQKAHRHEAVLRACRNWRDVVDDDGQEVPFCEDALRRMLQFPFCRTGIYEAYAASLVPGEARKGN